LRRAMIKSVSKGRSKSEVGGLKTGVMKIRSLPGRRSPRRRQTEAPLDADELVKHLEDSLTVQGQQPPNWGDRSREHIRKYLSPNKKVPQSPYSSSDDGPNRDDPIKGDEKNSLQVDESPVCALAAYREAGDDFEKLCFKCQTKDDIQLPVKRQSRPLIASLRRIHSFSSIDDLVFDRSQLLSIPVVAKSYGRVANCYNRIGGVAASLEAVKDDVSDRLNVFNDNLTRDTSMMRKTSVQLDAMTDNVTELRVKVEKIEALAARLQYESRMVDMKIKDVEDSILSFGSKLEELEARSQYSKGSPKSFIQARYWNSHPVDQFSSWFSFLHRYLTTQSQSND
jgi:hypothetical protein